MWATSTRRAILAALAAFFCVLQTHNLAARLPSCAQPQIFQLKPSANSSAVDGRHALTVQICDAAAQLTVRLRRAGGICVRGIDAAAAR